MDYANHILNNNLVEAFGWAIVHSIWQIALWSIVAVTVLILTHKRKANIRYLILSAILIGVCITSVLTFKKYITGEEIRKSEIVIFETPVTEISRQNNIIPPDSYLINDKTIQIKQKILTWFRDYFEVHLPGIVSLWFLGFVFLFLRYLGSFVWIMRLKGSYETASDDFQDLIYKLSRKLQMKRIVDIGTTIRINAPVTIGHFKPVILLPARLFTGLTNDQLESILLHELAHIKRNDFFINLIQGFVEVVFFYHPAIWWMSAAIRTEREHACDDLALKGGANAISLAQTLAGLADFLSPNPQFSQAFSGKQHTIKNRIHRLILNEKMKTNHSEKVIVAIAIVVSVAALSFSIQKDSPLSLPEQETVAISQLQPQNITVQNVFENTDTLKTPLQSVVDEETQEKEIEPELSENIAQNDTTDNDESDDEAPGQALKNLMEKGAKEWNKYREAHPGENFEDLLKESNLSGYDLSNFNLSNMNLKEATLVNTNFTNANMTGVNIKEANVKGAIFERTDLSNSDMKELYMNGNNLRNAIIKGANLKEITLINCDLSGVDLTGCNFSEATIKNCKFKGAVANHTTLFPSGFSWSENGIEFK